MAGNARAYSLTTKATVTKVASSATNVTLLAANPNRQGAYIYNDGSGVLYIKCGATAVVADSFTHQEATETGWEIPAGYTGIIDGIWTSANGAAMVTEFT
jgi:hypothetical protein